MKAFTKKCKHTTEKNESSSDSEDTKENCAPLKHRRYIKRESSGSSAGILMAYEAESKARWEHQKKVEEEMAESQKEKARTNDLLAELISIEKAKASLHADGL